MMEQKKFVIPNDLSAEALAKVECEESLPYVAGLLCYARNDAEITVIARSASSVAIHLFPSGATS